MDVTCATGSLLEGKVAFITGAGQGIGLAIAEAYAAQGASVVLTDVVQASVERSAARFPDPSKALAIALDVTSHTQTANALSRTLERFGKVDCVVANAGILIPKRVVDLKIADWQQVLDVNLTGAFLTAQTFAHQLVSQGSGGRIIFTSSLFGLRGGVENGAYSASKFGVIGLMQCLAAELAPYRILVNAVCPGQVESKMIRELFRERAASSGQNEEAIEEAFLRRIPLGHLVTTQDLAGTYVYLASDLCRYTTGQSFTVDGGWQLH